MPSELDSASNNELNGPNTARRFTYVQDDDDDASIHTEKRLRFNFKSQKVKTDNALRSTHNYLVKYYKPTPTCFKSFWSRRLPIINWTRKYKYREYAFKDLIAGLTIGVYQIPQGLAYGLMAGMPAINGLYVSFFNMLLYVIFGTSRHLSVGTYAIVSVMVESAIKKHAGTLYPYDSSKPVSKNASVNFISHDPVEAEILIGMSLAMLSGLILIGLAILHVGVVTKYFSEPVIKGFISSVALHIVVSQLSKLLGITYYEELNIPFKIIAKLILLFKYITKTNWVTCCISVVTMTFIFVIKVFVNEKYKSKMAVPIPIELIVVVFGTLISFLAKFENYGVKIIGFLPLGLPAPRPPSFKLFERILLDGISIAIVTFAFNISIGKWYAKKNGYHVRPNQELFTYGISNIFTSFFSGFPASAALSCSPILDNIGAKTQVHGLYGSFLILIVILFLGTYLRTLPIACLASMIVVSLKVLVLQVLTLPTIFRKSKLDGLAFLITYAGVVIIDVDIGLYIGIAASLLLIIFRSQRARISIIGNIPGTNIFECKEAFPEARELERLKILRFEESIYYANVDTFKYKIVKAVDIDPVQVIKEQRKQAKQLKKTTGMANGILDHHDPYGRFGIRHIILDCSCVNYIDEEGVEAILQLYEGYSEIGIDLYLSYCKPLVIRSFAKHSLHEKMDMDLIYKTVYDAVNHVKRREKAMRISSISAEMDDGISFSHEPGHVNLAMEVNSDWLDINHDDAKNSNDNNSDYNNSDDNSSNSKSSNREENMINEIKVIDLEENKKNQNKNWLDINHDDAKNSDDNNSDDNSSNSKSSNREENMINELKVIDLEENKKDPNKASVTSLKSYSEA